MDQNTKQWYLVHSVKGVACGPKLEGTDLRVAGGTLGRVRPLSGRELWEMQGGSVSQHPVMLKAAVREVGWRAGQSLLQALFTEVPSVAGVLDPEEVAALGQLEVWLKAWGRNPRHPAK